MAKNSSPGAAIFFLVILYFIYWVVKRRKRNAKPKINLNDAQQNVNSIPQKQTPSLTIEKSMKQNDLEFTLGINEDSDAIINQGSDTYSTIDKTNDIEEEATDMGSFSDFISSEKGENFSEKYWVPVGKEVSICGFKIASGLFYLSESGKKWDEELSCIDPDLKISKTDSGNRSDSDMYSYSYGYKSTRMYEKTLYLQWHGSGRKDRTLPQLLMLFLMGLERRVLEDTKTSESARNEVPLILEEVERLAQLYAISDSFEIESVFSKLNEFASFIRLKYFPETIKLPEPRSHYLSGTFPMALRYKIAENAAAGIPLSKELALLWCFFNPYNYYRSTYINLKKEFEILFTRAYENKYKGGLEVKNEGGKLEISYQRTNSRLSYIQTVRFPKLKDVVGRDTPPYDLYALYDECSNKLHSLNNYLGRNPGEVESIDFLARYPVELESDLDNPLYSALKSWVLDLFKNNNDVAIVSVPELRDRCKLGASEKVHKSLIVATATFLSKLGYGIEPDIRFSSYRFPDYQKVTLFRLDGKAEVAPTEDYQFALLFLHLAVAMSVVDGVSAEVEKEHLRDWINKSKEFSLTEKTRLLAHLEWLISDTPKLGNMKKKLQSLNEAQKSAFVNHLLAIIAVDGRIEPQEINMLEKVYVWLGRDANSLFSDIHGFQENNTEELVTILKGDRTNQEFSIPSPKASTGQVIKLDEAKIHAKLRDTAHVSGLLASVFSSEDETIATPVINANHSDLGPVISGLDEQHSKLVFELSKQPSFSRNEYEILCSTLGLFPDGALETINDVAFGVANEGLVDEDDAMIVNANVLKLLINQ